MKSWATEFGYELIDADWKLAYQPPDPQLAQVVQEVLLASRARQQRLIAAAPAVYSKKPKAVYRASPTRGGSVRVGGSADDDEDAGDLGFSSDQPAGRIGRGYGSTGSAQGQNDSAAPTEAQRVASLYGNAGNGTSGTWAPGGQGSLPGNGGGSASTGGMAGAMQNRPGYPGGSSAPGSSGIEGGAVGPSNNGTNVLGYGGGSVSGGSIGGGSTSGGPIGYAGSSSNGGSISDGSNNGASSGGGSIGGGSTSGGPIGYAGSSSNGGSISDGSNNGASIGGGSISGGGPSLGSSMGYPDTGLKGQGTLTGNSGQGTGNSGGGTWYNGQAAGNSGPAAGDKTSGRPTTMPEGYIVGQPPSEQPAPDQITQSSENQSTAKRVMPLRPGEWQPHENPPAIKPVEVERDDKNPSKHGKSLASKRGKDWALPDAAGGSVPITRPIRVECRADRIIIVPEAGQSGGKIVPLGPSTEASTQAFISAIWEQMGAWGIAGRGMYWRPVIHVSVAPGAEQRFADLAMLMEGSGLKIERK